MAESLLSLGDVQLGRTVAQRRTLRGAIATAIALHAVVFGLVILRPHTAPVRVSTAPSGAMTAYVDAGPRAAGTSGVTRKVSTPRPPRRTMPAKVAEPQPVSNEAPGEASGAAAQASGGAQGGGPVRIGSGQLELLKRVEPIYPPQMISARQTGTVVVDAIIRPDGTVDDVKVLQSQGPLFDRAAITAVKQWRYSPPGSESVLTVTVIFSIR
jgi:TonB family protein